MKLYFRHESASVRARVVKGPRRYDKRRNHAEDGVVQDVAIRERVWGFLLENRDAHTPGGQLVVNSVRQEDIAARVGLSLHEVIEAIDTLNREGRLQVERQPVGRPNRYLIRDREARTDSIAI